MVAFIALNPCACGAMVWRKGSRLRVTAVVKATFSLPPSGAMHMLAPIVFCRQEVRRDNLPAASVVAPSDWLPYRPRADVTLVGHAHAAGGAPAHHSQVRLTVLREGRLLINKTLAVRGDDGGAVAFTQMPIEYERALGGLGRPDNPIGVGASAGDAQPNILYPRDPDQVAGYGPISDTWPQRKAFRGSFKRNALEQATVEVPANLDYQYFQAAPADQRVEYLSGSETIVLEGLHRSAERIEARLPGARAVGAFFGMRSAADDNRTLVAFEADALHIDSDRDQCTATWRGVLELADEAALSRGLIVAGVAVDGAPVVVPERRSQVAQPAKGAHETVFGMQLSAGARDPAHDIGAGRTLPFTSAPRPARPAAAPAAPVPGAPWASEPAVIVTKPGQDQQFTAEIGGFIARPKPEAPKQPVQGGTLEVDRANLMSTAAPFAIAQPGSSPSPKDPGGAPWEKSAPPGTVGKPKEGQLSTVDMHGFLPRPGRSAPAPSASSSQAPATPPAIPAPAPEPAERIIPATPPAMPPREALPAPSSSPSPAQPARWARAPESDPAPAPPEPKQPKRMPKKLDFNALVYGGKKPGGKG